MTLDRRPTRRDFLRLRRTERGRVLELSCRALFMRCADAAIAPAVDVEYDPSMGEPPAVIRRRSPDELMESIEQELGEVQVLRLSGPEWLENIEGAARLRAACDAFRARGGVIESAADENNTRDT
jgi:hypothetical protein